MGGGIAHQPLDCNDASPVHKPGQLLFHANGNIYRYVQILEGTAAVAVKAGDVAYYSSTDKTIVNIDLSDVATNVQAAGIIQAVVTDTYYGWILVSGDYATVNTDGGVAAAGEALVGHSVDGEVDTFADGEEEQVVGVSLAADDASDDVPAIIRLL